MEEITNIIKNSFCNLIANETMLSLLNAQNITSPTTIQSQVIPQVLTDNNVVFASTTGTGKTLAYLLPLSQKILQYQCNSTNTVTRVLIIAPTFELSSQIKTQVKLFSPLSVALCIGGTGLKRQIETLKTSPNIVVGTPTRLLELLHLKKLKPQGLFAIVLDEVDRLLSKEIREDTLSLFKFLPKDTQVIACSATVLQKHIDTIRDTIKTQLHLKPTKVILQSSLEVIQNNIEHWLFYAQRRDKIDMLRKILTAQKMPKVLIFTSKLDQVANIAQKLQFHKINCASLHSRTEKNQRKSIIDNFRNGKCNVLVTSDLTSRGLDIPNITHIIQMDINSDIDFFIHRAGRTARAGGNGINIVIADEYEIRKLTKIENNLGIKIYPKDIHGGKLINIAL